MAKASFYVNSIKVRKKEDYLVLEARKQCQHGTVFDEVFLTLPGELSYLFNDIENPSENEFKGESVSLLERFKRFNETN
jgi:hypothetical protein